MDGLLRFHAHHHQSIGHEQRVFSSFLHFHRIKDPFSSLLFRWPSKSETAPIPEQYPGAANEIWTDWYSESRRPSEYQILCFLVWFDMYLVMALILSHCINCGWLNSTTLALGFSVIEFSTLFFFHSIDGYDLAAPSQPWACELESRSAEIDPQYLMGHDLTTPLVDFQLQHWW